MKGKVIFSASAGVLAAAIAGLVPISQGADEPLPAFLDPARLAAASCGRAPAGNLVKSWSARIAAITPALAPPAAARTADDAPPLWEGTGNSHFPISSKVERAQSYFNQGLRLVYGFNHWEAIRAFRAAQKLDPDCAICYWGEALALGPNINAPMQPATLDDALALVRKAKERAKSASPEEQALISALEVRYDAAEGAERADLDLAYAEAMKKVHERFPDNPDIASLYAEAIMDTSPWDYWESDFRTPKPPIATAIGAVEKVLAANPDHMGAIHLYIHLMEASAMPDKAEPYADKLAAIAPGLGHLVHMPGHIYFRIGRYLDSLETNKRAVAQDSAYLDATEGADIYRFGYYPHNVHFVLVSAALAGDGPTALDAGTSLDRLMPYEILEQVAWTQPVKAAPYFVQLQFGEPESVLAIEEPPAHLPLLRGLWHYARGVAHALEGNAAGARKEAEAIHALREDPGVLALPDQGVPAPGMLKIAELVVSARADRVQKRHETAVSKLQEAAKEQRSLAYMEPPFWYYPVEQTLGATLLEMGRHQEAADAFSRSLRDWPNNAWSLFGLLQAQRAMKDPAAGATEALYRRAVAPDAAEFELARF